MVNGLTINHANGNGNGHSHISDSGSETSGASSNGSANRRIKLSRKMSSPMAPPFMVSAPGKVIVFGEHSVVHGKVCQAYLIVNRMLTSPLAHRQPSPQPSRCDPIFTLPRFPSQNVPSLSDSPISILFTPGILTTYHGMLSNIRTRRSHIILS
jgi:hypothetical protein